ncbi:Serine/threonine-protein phosphatase PP-X 1 [Tritrichomonas foetus]|uniref:Serine/threonine-protein phosphatase n=1 Tax=Tritrichomonas foetus TaxID=1144522 RepID=A0A1J4JEB0_9EUKA|nr:Serine/threonine-protein phosphatase PP-X 1 [Tritrichomonas foetus]|eukprot:OHS95596.1 Serine/threonine-protein phosphatase PP-X 1 [Tritrichomonas foetus]
MDLDEIISHLRNGEHPDESCAKMLLEKLMEVLYNEGNVLNLQAPITICGDIHGQLYDLFELFRIAGQPPETKFLFMGDYVDRGFYSLETFLYLAALKLRYPDTIYLLRGNHECRSVNHLYGFYEDCIQNYGHSGVWFLCNDVFDLLPMAAVISNSIFSVHGGLSPEISLIEQISLKNRQEELLSYGSFCDLCWSDPDDITNWGVNSRGAGYLFGSQPVSEFCHNNKISLITRAHQLAMAGYDYRFDQQLITVWSAPNYMYRSGNIASVLAIDEHLNRELKTFREVPDEQRKRPTDTVPQYFA